MKKYIYIGITMLLVITCGCSTLDNTQKSGIYPQGDGSVTIVDGHAVPKKSEKEIRQLTKDAKAGDGKAAFALASYYDFSEEGNAKYAAKYHRLAEKLKYPHELFRISLIEWGSKPNPDLKKTEDYARKAAQAGVERADELLVEIVEARTSGVIPNETKFRLVVPKS